MNISTPQYAKNTLLSSTLFLPALAMAIWAGTLSGSHQLVAVLAAMALALGGFCFARRKDDLVHDFFLPIILFAALGGMTWAVRGSSGYGAVKGCVFAGVMWGAAWWFIARDSSGEQRRRYASGWIVLALTLGIGLAGARGWMQWSTFFDGFLQTNTGQGESVPISPTYGFIWLFIAGMPWAGLGACALAWCALEKPLAAWQWAVRLFCGFGAAYFANWLFQQYPHWFLPLHSTMADRYADLEANPNLRRLINDNGNAVRHMGFYLGFLLFELGRRDWKNVTLISTVGILNGLGWALCQNWKWSDNVWPEAQFNFWRAWETSGGISIGIAFGVAYYLVNRKQADPVPAAVVSITGSRFPWFGALSITFMLVVLGWFAAISATGIFSAAWRENLDALAFCAVLAYGIIFYGWRLRASMTADPEATPVTRPNFTLWLASFGLMVLIAWFMMGRLAIRGAEDTVVPWWGRLDYMYLGVTLAYGALFVLTYLWVTLSVRPEHASDADVFFTRYPSIDWLATYLSLALILSYFLAPELPAWKGWLWMAEEERTSWYGLLGLACVAFFGVAYCVFSYWSSRGTEDTGEGHFGIDPNLERFGVYLGLLVGLGMSIKNGTRGWANVYLQELNTEQYFGDLYWRYIGPGMLAVLIAIVLLVLIRRIPRGDQRDPLPHAFSLIVLVLVVQNLLAHAITGPPSSWNEVVYNLYYVLLFLISAVVLYHYHFINTRLPALVAAYATPGAAIAPVMAPVHLLEPEPEPDEDLVAEFEEEEQPEPVEDEEDVEALDDVVPLYTAPVDDMPEMDENEARPDSDEHPLTLEVDEEELDPMEDESVELEEEEDHPTPLEAGVAPLEGLDEAESVAGEPADVFNDAIEDASPDLDETPMFDDEGDMVIDAPDDDAPADESDSPAEDETPRLEDENEDTPERHV